MAPDSPAAHSPPPLRLHSGPVSWPEARRFDRCCEDCQSRSPSGCRRWSRAKPPDGIPAIGAPVLFCPTTVQQTQAEESHRTPLSASIQQTACDSPEATAPLPCTGSGLSRWLQSGRNQKNAATPCWPQSHPARSQRPPASRPNWSRRERIRRTPFRPFGPQPRKAPPRQSKTGSGMPGMQGPSAAVQPARPALSERWIWRRATPISSASGWRRVGTRARRPRVVRCLRPVQGRCSGRCRQQSRIARWLTGSPAKSRCR